MNDQDMAEMMADMMRDLQAKHQRVQGLEAILREIAANRCHRYSTSCQQAGDPTSCPPCQARQFLQAAQEETNDG